MEELLQEASSMGRVTMLQMNKGGEWYSTIEGTTPRGSEFRARGNGPSLVESLTIVINEARLFNAHKLNVIEYKDNGDDEIPF